MHLLSIAWDNPWLVTIIGGIVSTIASTLIIKLVLLREFRELQTPPTPPTNQTPNTETTTQRAEESIPQPQIPETEDSQLPEWKLVEKTFPPSRVEVFIGRLGAFSFIISILILPLGGVISSLFLDLPQHYIENIFGPCIAIGLGFSFGLIFTTGSLTRKRTKKWKLIQEFKKQGII